MSSSLSGPSGPARSLDLAAPVAAFDVDGTLTRRDTMVPFLVRVHGPVRVAGALAGAVRHPRDRDEAKAVVVDRLFRGGDPATIAELGRTYAAEVAARRLRAPTVARLAWHREQGHRIVLVSASLAVYIAPLAEHVGADHVVATALETGPDGRLTGRIDGVNVRGRHKPVLFRALLDELGVAAGVETWAYGNAGSDRALLEASDHPVWVGRRAGSPLPPQPRPAAGES